MAESKNDIPRSPRYDEPQSANGSLEQTVNSIHNRLDKIEHRLDLIDGHTNECLGQVTGVICDITCMQGDIDTIKAALTN